MSDAIRVVGMMSGTSMDGIDVAEVVMMASRFRNLAERRMFLIQKMSVKSCTARWGSGADCMYVRRRNW